MILKSICTASKVTLFKVSVVKTYSRLYYTFSGPKVTIIDTPGFFKEQREIDDLFDFLKDDIKYIHVFVIAVNGEDGRLKLFDSMKSMISRFQDIFGHYFWDNTIIVVTKWGYDSFDTKDREQQGVSEEKWQDVWDKIFHEEFDIKVS